MIPTLDRQMAAVNKQATHKPWQGPLVVPYRKNQPAWDPPPLPPCPPAPLPPPPADQSDHRGGKNEIYDGENLVGPYLVHKVLDPRPPLPPPLPPFLIFPGGGGGF